MLELSKIDEESKPLPPLKEILRGFNSFSELPGYLRIQVVGYCNQECYFCHNEGIERSKNEIDFDLVKKAISASSYLGKSKVSFTGGEPLLRKSFPEFLYSLKGQNPQLKIGITSNGTRLHQVPRFFFSEGIIEELSISLHSLEEENYFKITKRRDLNSVLNNLEALRESGFGGISINMVVGTLNLSEISAMAEYCFERKFKLKLLDILGNDPRALPKETIQKESTRVESDMGYPVGAIVLKPKKYHSKCVGCQSLPLCGEGEYLRLSVDHRLIPCLFRRDLEQKISLNDDLEVLKRKIALGFRRIELDNL